MMEYIKASSEYQSSFGFRLQPSREKETCGSSRDSVASYKQRIDSMFDETQSEARGRKIHSQRNQLMVRKTWSVIDGEDANKLIENDKLLIKNMVQARIEKMFEEVEGDGEGKMQRSKLDPSTFNIDYLGSLPLLKKVSSLEGLQEPLKDLYLNYKQMGHIRPIFQDVLEISNCGLRVKYMDEKQDELVEQLNPFPTIAVWAAVKFVCRPRGLDHGKEFGLEYAFVPLISDPESTDKITLFRKLTPNEACYFTGDYYSDHSPLFVAVMRKIGVSRQLECHGFVCDSNENAIVIAANLYKALVITMVKNQASENCVKKRDLKHKNGISAVCSVDGSSLAGDFESLSIMKDDNNSTKLLLTNQKKEFGPSTSRKSSIPMTSVPSKIPPPRPPRKGKLSPIRNVRDSVVLHVKHPDPDEILQLPSPPSPSPQFLKSNSFNFSNANRDDIMDPNKIIFEQSLSKAQLRRTNNRNQSFKSKQNSFRSKEFSERGDILTKVAIPRSHSFLNANGPLSSRYNRHSSTGLLLGNNINRKNSLGSPLGLNELFTEFRLQEGLNNMEDILNAIIDPDGMSFNDLKPIYKEFLLKLAVTLTKDEMYQRSKSIMQRQKSRKKKISRKTSCKFRKTFSAGKGLRRAFRKSLLKLKFSKSKSKGFEFPSVLLPSCTRIKSKKSVKKTTTYLKSYGFPYSSSSNESSLLTHDRQTSFKVKQNSVFDPIHVPLTEANAIATSSSPLHTYSKGKETKTARNSVSEDSDFFSSMPCNKIGKPVQQNKSKIHGSENCLHQASSGYFSCSDCSYDSESCMCASADKCYCSMGKHGRTKQLEENEEKNMSLTSCECDTDSCFESEKCYCNQKRKPSLFEQLKQQGFAASESSLSRANSPNTAWQKNEAEILNSKEKDKACKQGKSELQSSKSLEFLKIRPRSNPTSQTPRDTKYFDKSNNIYQSPIEALERDLINDRKIKSSISSSPITTSSESKSNKSLESQRRSSSSDNLALDYNLFSTNSKSSDETPPEDQDVQQRKVLVVSTRDPKGRVIYMSAAQRYHSPLRIFNSKRNHTTDPFSVKKTAEIAALFSDVKFNHRASNSISSTKEEVIYNTLEPPDYFFVRSGSNYMNNVSLENSLGYFP